MVPFESSQVGHARKEVILGLPGNHSEICKFSGPSDPAYKAVFGALQDYVREATGAMEGHSSLDNANSTPKLDITPQLEELLTSDLITFLPGSEDNK